jgi:hypothetical protein
MSLERGSLCSADVLDDLDQLVQAVALTARELDKLPRSLDDCTTLGRPRNRDATSTSELQQSLVPQQPERPQDGVGVDAEDGSEVLGRREALSRLRFPLGDCPTDLAGHLLVQVCGVGFVYLVAFVGHANGMDIFVVNADGLGLRNVTRTPGDDLNPSWSLLQKN